jgi:hypothetical protein
MNRELSKILSLIVLIGSVGFFEVGCEPVRHYDRLQVAAYAGSGKTIRKPYGSVAVFQKPEDIKRPYEIIGMLSCEGSAGEEAGILNAMLYRAADMGGDGVLLGGPRIGAEDLAGNNVTLNLREGWATLMGTGNSDHRAYRSQIVRFKD